MLVVACMCYVLCSFCFVLFSNAGQFNRWRGGAIKTELGTSLTISTSKFVGNSAGGGGAIFHRGNTLSINDSLFLDNYAKVSLTIGLTFVFWT